MSDPASDEVSSYNPPPAHPVTPAADQSCDVSRKRRQEVVTLLSTALSARGAVFSSAQTLFLSGEFELEIFNSAKGGQEYEQLVLKKLKDLDYILPETTPEAKAGDTKSGPTAAADKKRASRTTGAAPREGVHDAEATAESKQGVKSAAGQGAQAKPASVAEGDNVSDKAWVQLQHLNREYLNALRACLVALANRLKEITAAEAEPASKEIKLAAEGAVPATKPDIDGLKAFKRLVLGLVLFLSASREKIPARFTEDKLKRLEGEIVEILGTVRSKDDDKIVSLGEKRQEVDAAWEKGNERMQKYPPPPALAPDVPAGRGEKRPLQAEDERGTAEKRGRTERV